MKGWKEGGAAHSIGEGGGEEEDVGCWLWGVGAVRGGGGWVGREVAGG